jgi:YidC/Oxa1 family membrane protein insertase
MEKRIFLAISLSLIVVWFWSAMVPSSSVVSKKMISSQPIENKENFDIQKILKDQPHVPVDEIKNEEVITLSSDKLKAEFSNIGGSLNAVIIKEYSASLPIEKIAGLHEYDNRVFIANQESDTSISYIYENSYTKIIKRYEIIPNEYVIKNSIEIHNKSNMSKIIDIFMTGYILKMSNLEKNNLDLSNDKLLFEYVVFTENGIHRKAGAFKFNAKEEKKEIGKVYWSGFRDRYFCAIIKPQFNTTMYSIIPISDKLLKVSMGVEKVTILPNSSVKFGSVIYIGPERLDILKSYNAGFEKIKKYYRFGLFDGIAKIIGSLMYFIYKFIPNWGITIVIISTLIYFSMYPLTLKGMMSMKKMQTIQPMIMHLKEKHKDNPNKLNKEMMELYKEHKVNPIGGCLPMLLQMPVFIGLYQVLWRSVTFKGAKFLWINDLSQPDRLFVFPLKLPFIENELNLLPILIAVIMFVQQKFTSKSMVITDHAQAVQQKMISTIMPFFIGFIFYKFASGLTLYFTMFYIFSAFSQWKMSKSTNGA